MNRNSLFIAGAFLAGGALGAVGGYKLAEKRLIGEFNEAVDAEREATRAMYNTLPAEPNQTFSSPEEAVKELVLVEEAMKLYRGEDDPKEPVAYHRIKSSKIKVEKAAEPEKPAPVQEENIFAINEEVGDVAIISRLDFESGDSGYDQITLNYYEGDQVLADMEDEKIEDIPGVIGDGLNHFGFISDDPNVVHVRNRKLRIEYEVCKDPRAWATVAHGLEPAPDRPSQQGG